MYNCKACRTAFRSISTLRKHQWSEHREFYANVTAKGKSLVPVKSTNNNNMAVVELLDKLTDQRNLLDNTIALIKGVMARYDK